MFFTLPYLLLIYSCSLSLPVIKKLMRKVCTQVLGGGECVKGGGTTWRATPCQDTHCVSANLCLCTQGRNTLIDTLVRDTTHSCKHPANTHVQRSFTSLRAHTQPQPPTGTLQSYTIKPFSGCFFLFLSEPA